MGRKLTYKELEQRVKELEIKLDASRKVDPFTVWQRFKGNRRAYGFITPDNLQSQKKHPKKVWIRGQENKPKISPFVNLLNC